MREETNLRRPLCWNTRLGRVRRARAGGGQCQDGVCTARTMLAPIGADAGESSRRRCQLGANRAVAQTGDGHWQCALSSLSLTLSSSSSALSSMASLLERISLPPGAVSAIGPVRSKSNHASSGPYVRPVPCLTINEHSPHLPALPPHPYPPISPVYHFSAS